VYKGLEELATASRHGIFVYREKIPVRQETRQLCDVAGIDPLGMFSSGALLVSISPERVHPLLDEYRKAGMLAEDIGRIVPREEGMTIGVHGNNEPLKASHKDGLIEYINGIAHNH